ncbi:MAG TPA: thioredoxin domain-containing protein [Gemmatimonadaceae bacterium]|jgi:hypothetical protein|nr:thioredoxin domain-containing protein [Gemmatimonadaceae bacterium]
MPNRLATETSPYLLQHANNPVDWYPWGTEALERAVREDTPILLSIGYAACHWCHVMEHESFEDGATAAFMNERFVNIKVDREERPDIDAIYMQAVQAMTGHGGWPMTMFLTPDGVPFYGGTYFPRDDRHGMPSFRKVLMAVSDAYRSKPETVQRTAASVREMYEHTAHATRSGGALGPDVLDAAYRALAGHYDERNGGFSDAPKFPQTMSLDFLLRYWARRGTEQALAMVHGSFLRMARGGIYDQVGGGFARYSVDALWLVPHFEKMLYDNALLIRLGANLWQATHDDEVRRVVDETITWAAREMQAPDGGFVSSYDADSEGHEGRFYVWSAAELDAALGADAAVMRAYWGVTEEANFEGSNILSVTSDPRAVAARFRIGEAELRETVMRAKRTLYDIRRTRVWPGRDDKVLASWNGLMVRGIAEAARAFDDAEYRRAAVESAEFLFDRLVVNARVFRSFKDGRARIAGYLEDHAALGLAAVAVYMITFDASWLRRARELAGSVVRWFWDDDEGAFFDTASDHERLIIRPREVTDNATPSGTSLAVELLLLIAELDDDDDARRRAVHVLESLVPAMSRYPTAFGHLLGCADIVVNGAVELGVTGNPDADDFRSLTRTAAEEYVPSVVIAGGLPDSLALLRDRPMREGHATAYVCRHYSCDEPVTAPERLRELLLSARSARGAPAIQGDS